MGALIIHLQSFSFNCSKPESPKHLLPHLPSYFLPDLLHSLLLHSLLHHSLHHSLLHHSLLHSFLHSSLQPLVFPQMNIKIDMDIVHERWGYRDCKYPSELRSLGVDNMNNDNDTWYTRNINNDNDDIIDENFLLMILYIRINDMNSWI